MAAFNHPHYVRVRTSAAHIISTAAVANPTFQTHLLEEVPDIFDQLLTVSAAQTVRPLLVLMLLMRLLSVFPAGLRKEGWMDGLYHVRAS
jgi:hypothetical protein